MGHGPLDSLHSPASASFRRQLSGAIQWWPRVVLLAVCLGPPPSAASPVARWDLLSGPADPPPFSGRAIHDTRRNRMVYVEGVNPGEIWTLSLPTSGTPAWQRVFV